MSSEVDKTYFLIPLDQPVVHLEASTAFNGLTSKEKHYAYYLSKASWVGGLITLLQTSSESGPIFVLLHKFFSSQTIDHLKANAKNAEITEDEVKALLVYAAGIFSNAGNYKGYGDSKFVPSIEPSQLELLLKLSPIWSEIEPLWEKYKDDMYDLTPQKTCLGFPPHCYTTYVSKNFIPKDNEHVQEWLKKQHLELYNTRCFKTENSGKTTYEIRLASKECSQLEKVEHNGSIFILNRGDYSPLMDKVALYLQEAIPYAANEVQSNMLKAYVKSFMTGSLQEHKRGSRFWIQDKVPAVETYIGFIETYRDPTGVRGEFEGFVAAVNRDMSAKFAKLVDSAEKLLTLLPWSRGFEKDRFLRPDFTSLDVLAFAGSGIPAGINIPNYDDIRQSEGFKNVSLGNVIPASYQQSNTPFLNDSDRDLLQRWRVVAFEVQVGLHELLGHGSGKLLQKESDGTVNYPATLLDPLTGNPPTSCYEPGDTYDSQFGRFSSAYEECRAEAVGLYLSLEESILSIFGYEGSEAENITYVNWLSLVWAGLCSLEMWDPMRGWLQAHSQARFVLMQVLIQAGIVNVTQPDPQDLLLTLDRASLKGAGRNAIGHFLLQLQIYKSTANVDAAKKLFNLYSNVAEPWKSWRDIILTNKRPRKMFSQPNMFLQNKEIILKAYDASPEGLIQSWIERFTDPQPLYQALLQLSIADAHHFC